MFYCRAEIIGAQGVALLDLTAGVYLRGTWSRAESGRRFCRLVTRTYEYSRLEDKQPEFKFHFPEPSTHPRVGQAETEFLDAGLHPGTIGRYY
jgi:hypothetical protein